MLIFKILLLVTVSASTQAADLLSFAVCKTSQDCVIAPADFCGCGGMGTNTAVSKATLKKWNVKLQNEGENMGCLAANSDHWTCTKKVKADCVKKQCTILEIKSHTTQAAVRSSIATATLKLRCFFR